jgi:hypothetical protein
MMIDPKTYQATELQNNESQSHLPGDSESPQVPAWELVDTGRYMPRRIRGSNRGRELG